MQELDSLGARIRYIQQKLGGWRVLEAMTKISQSQISRMIRNDIKNPGLYTIKAIADAGGVSLEWMVSGTEEPLESASSESEGLQLPASLPKEPCTEVAAPSDSYIAVPFVIGNGKPPVQFDYEFLTNILGVSTENARLYEQESDAMHSTVKKDDFVLLDVSKKNGNGIFLVRIEGSLYLQRLQYMPGTGVEVISDNKNYKPYSLRLEQVEVIGALSWVGTH